MLHTALLCVTPWLTPHGGAADMNQNADISYSCYTGNVPELRELGLRHGRAVSLNDAKFVI